VAGTNGSGKSEWLRMAIGSLCAAGQPASLQLILIDPKRTAFSVLCDSPFLRRPIVYPSDEDVLSMLDDLVAEMESRFGLFEGAQVKNMEEYNARAAETLPRLICVCDEYADLVLAGTKRAREIERRVGRLGAKGRAAGVHLILATQRPSRDVVTGIIRSNMNARVALKVNEKIESRIILDQGGAEQLLGSGDLLFRDLGPPVRLQSPLIQDAELRQAARCP
jgi:DNA segregation ATPase FtsK/SpoIIIE, S-DNA-T family